MGTAGRYRQVPPRGAQGRKRLVEEAGGGAILLRPATIAAWTKRVDEEGEGAILQTPEPINRFPDFVRHIVCRLKVLCPTMGKKRIAHTLARAGFVLGFSTVGRMLKEREENGPEPDQTNGAQEQEAVAKNGKPVQAHTRLRAELAEARREISQLQEELRLKDLRMSRVRPRRRPHYRLIPRRLWNVGRSSRSCR